MAHENIELMPISSTSEENSNTAAILISTESGDDDDNQEHDFPDQQGMEMLPMPSTSQGKGNASDIVISIENIDDDDDDDNDDEEEEENSSGFLVQAKIEVLHMPSTSQGNSDASAILKSFETNDDGDDEEADSFTTQKLFSFAWQIAKGMVGICKAISK